MIEKDGVEEKDEEEVIQHLRQLIRKQIGGFAIPEYFLVSAGVIVSDSVSYVESYPYKSEGMGLGRGES